MDPKDVKVPNRTNRQFYVAFVQTMFWGNMLSNVRRKGQRFFRFLGPYPHVAHQPDLEVDISRLEIDKVYTFFYKKDPIFVRRRSQAEIEAANAIDYHGHRDPQSDAERFHIPEVQVMYAICTHLGCTPYPNEGNYEMGFFCPCHGSHYDRSGRIMEGPAGRNLPVPHHTLEDSLLTIGAD